MTEMPTPPPLLQVADLRVTLPTARGWAQALRGVSLHWFYKLAEGLGVVDIAAALKRSLFLGLVVMGLTMVLSVLAGLAFRKKLKGGNALFYITVASLIMPSIIVSLGIGLQFRLVDSGIKAALTAMGSEALLENYGTALGLLTSALGAHLTWTLPFGLLIMFAVFNRFNPAYEEAARDLGATPWQGFRHVVLPLIAPSAMMGAAVSQEPDLALVSARTLTQLGAVRSIGKFIETRPCSASTKKTAAWWCCSIAVKAVNNCWPSLKAWRVQPKRPSADAWICALTVSVRRFC